MDLTPARRRALKAQAHSLEPVVMIGDKGLSPAVLKEIDVNLKSHELIKIRVAGDDRALREDFLRQLCEALAATAVQHIGKILVVYRENPGLTEKAAAASARAEVSASRETSSPKRPASNAKRSAAQQPQASKPQRSATQPPARSPTPRSGSDTAKRRTGPSAPRPAAAGRAAKPARTPAGRSRPAGRTR